jgi:hypothetical protein
MPQLSLRVTNIQLLSSNKTSSNTIENNDFLNQPNGFEQTGETPF